MITLKLLLIVGQVLIIVFLIREAVLSRRIYKQLLEESIQRKEIRHD